MNLHRIASPLFALACAVAALPAAAQVTVPDGKFGIHYNRCDKAYEGWGLHLWRAPNSNYPGVSWGGPMKPAGSSDFGVYWVADLDHFGSAAEVNYIIHKGDTKEQGGSDMKFDAKTMKQIWVNSGDRQIYPSLEAALKARADKPCP